MCTYTGIRLGTNKLNEVDTQVTVDGQPLPSLSVEMPGAGKSFGWDSFSPWANMKLLAYSILFYELNTVEGHPESDARKSAIGLTDYFLRDFVTRFQKEWSITSEQIKEWIDKKHAEVHAVMAAGHF